MPTSTAENEISSPLEEGDTDMVEVPCKSSTFASLRPSDTMNNNVETVIEQQQLLKHDSSVIIITLSTKVTLFHVQEHFRTAEASPSASLHRQMDNASSFNNYSSAVSRDDEDRASMMTPMPVRVAHCVTF